MRVEAILLRYAYSNRTIRLSEISCQKYKSNLNKCKQQLFEAILVAIATLPYLIPYAEYSQLKCAWPWPLEWVMMNCICVHRKLIHDFTYDVNSNACPISVTICKTITIKICIKLILLIELTNVKCKCVNRRRVLDFLWDGNSNMFATSVTIYEIFEIKMCMALTLTFKSNEKMPIEGAMRHHIWWQ